MHGCRVNQIRRSHRKSRLAVSLPGVQWAIRTRQQPSYLQLGTTYEETLAELGQKTRSNLLYYRRRAEAELHCVFLPEPQISAKD